MKLPESFSGPSRARNGRRYVSLCKICKETIFADEARVWLTDPMGLSHERCTPDA